MRIFLCSNILSLAILLSAPLTVGVCWAQPDDAFVPESETLHRTDAAIEAALTQGSPPPKRIKKALARLRREIKRFEAAVSRGLTVRAEMRYRRASSFAAFIADWLIERSTASDDSPTMSRSELAHVGRQLERRVSNLEREVKAAGREPPNVSHLRMLIQAGRAQLGEANLEAASNSFQEARAIVSELILSERLAADPVEAVEAVDQPE